MTDETATTTPPVGPWRLWVTGRMPGGVVLPPLVGHDVPSAPVAVWGDVCTTQKCRKRSPHATQSLRFQPSGICVACWQRWSKKVTSDEEGPSQ
jgi:hypothetical protein